MVRWLRIVALAFAVAPLAGCGALRALDRPTAEIAGVKFAGLSVDSLTLAFDVKVSNPYAVPLPLVNLDYALASGGKPFLSGIAEMQGAVPAGNSKTVQLPAKVNFVETLRALQTARPGSVVPYAAEMGLSVDAPAIGRMRLPLRKEGKLPIPTAPDVKIEHIAWESLTLEEARGVVRLNVANRNEFAMKLAKMAYGLSLADTRIVESKVQKPVEFAAGGGTGIIEIPVTFSPKNLGLAAFKMLTGKGSGYKLDGIMDVDTPFGPIPLPIKAAGQTIFKR